MALTYNDHMRMAEDYVSRAAGYQGKMFDETMQLAAMHLRMSEVLYYRELDAPDNDGQGS